ncbi:MAG: hypothetical protein IM600_12240 [Bacteroidetes bacterium]|nr:hypothetical protein [Bacteroidota bacterium]MCA6444191.1 hypothetical protein [Bacteroidota bacterium]
MELSELVKETLQQINKAQRYPEKNSYLIKEVVMEVNIKKTKSARAKGSFIVSMSGDLSSQNSNKIKLILVPKD